MERKKPAIDKKNIKENQDIEKLSNIFKNYRFGGLNEQEKAQFKKAQLEEEQAKTTNFVLGEPIKHSF